MFELKLGVEENTNFFIVCFVSCVMGRRLTRYFESKAESTDPVKLSGNGWRSDSDRCECPESSLVTGVVAEIFGETLVPYEGEQGGLKSAPSPQY